MNTRGASPTSRCKEVCGEYGENLKKLCKGCANGAHSWATVVDLIAVAHGG
jgi:hypothetical protein